MSNPKAASQSTELDIARDRSLSPLLLGAAAFAGVTSALALAIVILVILSATDQTNEGAAGYLPLAYAALAVIIAAIAVSVFVRRVAISVSRGFAWLVGVVSFVVSFVPWWGLAGGNPDLGVLIYRGLRVPQGIIQFWDLSLVMQSVDCARWGFDIYAENNGCLADPSIYAPGMVWVQYIPFEIFSESNVGFLGVAMMLVSSLALLWLARVSAGIGQIVLLIAAIGGPWLLLLERANIDSVVLWVAVVSALLIRRFGSTQWPWVVAAILIWVVGTWKYYPFALGLMLIPVLQLRRGWIIFIGFVIASAGYVVVTWSNFQFSSQSNSNMIDFGDFVVLGRTPVAARMVALGDFMFFALGLVALAWGIWIARIIVARTTAQSRATWVTWAILAAGGSAVYLASVLIAGFGYGYKAAFLLLAIPLVSRLVGSKVRIIAASGLLVLLSIAIESVVVWNTVLVTTVGVLAAGFALGAGLTIASFAAVNYSATRHRVKTPAS